MLESNGKPIFSHDVIDGGELPSFQTEFLHTSIAGSYYVPCEILGECGEDFVITYLDPLLEEEVTKKVTKDEIKFEEKA